MFLIEDLSHRILNNQAMNSTHILIVDRSQEFQMRKTKTTNTVCGMIKT